MKQRISWIDTAKAIGIFMIVLDHTYLNEDPVRTLLAYSVPLFFFLSGLTFKPSRDWFAFLKNRFLRLYLPYLVVGFLSVMIYLMFGSVLVEGLELRWGTFLEGMKGLFFANSLYYHMEFNTPLWFLPVLFFCSIFCNFVLNLKQNWQKWLAVLLFFVAGHALSWSQNTLFFHLEAAGCMVLWMVSGFELKNEAAKRLETDSKAGLAEIFILSVAAFLFFGSLNRSVSVRAGIYGNHLFLYLASSIAVICGILVLAYWLRKSKALQYLGRHTLFILLWHRYTTVAVARLIPFFSSLLEENNFWIREGAAILLAVAAILLTLLMDWIWIQFKRYFEKYTHKVLKRA